MTASIPVVPRGGRIVAVLAIVLVALSMRNAVAVIGPVFSTISNDLGLDVVVLSFVGAAPPLAFAVAGLVVPGLVRRVGLEAMLIVSLVTILGGEVLRAFSSEAVLLVLTTTVTMLGIGSANVLLPPLVRRYFPERIGGMTSLYLVLMCVGASVPAFTGVLIAGAAGWQFAIGVWAVIPVLALVPWLALLRSTRPADPVTAPISTIEPIAIEPEVVEFDDGHDPTGPATTTVRRSMAFSPTAWALTACLAMSSISIYVAMAFLPSMLTAVGVTPVVAAFALGVAVVLGIPQALVVPLLATRQAAVLPMIVIAAFCGVAGWTGMLLAPAAAPVLWAFFIGSVPITFPLSLLLVNTRTRSHRVTVRVSAFVQGLGYVIAGVFSFGVGLLHDATDTWTAPTIVVLATVALAVPAIVILRRRRFVDDEIAPVLTRR
jgi:CP family cyanate transporter-like MFS transporter